jgi:hypothetical protein
LATICGDCRNAELRITFKSGKKSSGKVPSTTGPTDCARQKPARKRVRIIVNRFGNVLAEKIIENRLKDEDDNSYKNA